MFLACPVVFGQSGVHYGTGTNHIAAGGVCHRVSGRSRPARNEQLVTPWLQRRRREREGEKGSQIVRPSQKFAIIRAIRVSLFFPITLIPPPPPHTSRLPSPNSIAVHSSAFLRPSFIPINLININLTPFPHFRVSFRVFRVFRG